MTATLQTPGTPARSRRRYWWRRWRSVGVYAVITAMLVWTLAPYTWMVISSFSHKRDLIDSPGRIFPRSFTLDNYRELLGSADGGTNRSLMLSSLRNSAIIATGTTLIALMLGIFAAYALARFKFPGRGHYLVGLMSVQMVPPIAIVIPLYVILRDLNLLDTHIGVVLVYMSLILPLATWMMRSYFATIPRELEEAAMIDGASRLEALRRITVPLAIPGVITVAVFTFVVAWNEYLYAFTLTNVNAKTLPVLIGEFSTKLGLEHLKIAAAGVITSIPPLAIALAFQRYLIRGMTAGAIK